MRDVKCQMKAGFRSERGRKALRTFNYDQRPSLPRGMGVYYKYHIETI